MLNSDVPLLERNEDYEKETLMYQLRGGCSQCFVGHTEHLGSTSIDTTQPVSPCPVTPVELHSSVSLAHVVFVQQGSRLSLQSSSTPSEERCILCMPFLPALIGVLYCELPASEGHGSALCGDYLLLHEAACHEKRGSCR